MGPESESCGPSAALATWLAGLSLTHRRRWRPINTCGLLIREEMWLHFYRFHATTSVCEKQKKASGSRPQARQAATISSNSERVAIPNSKALTARLEWR